MATALTTLPNVKQWLKINGTADDALLTRLITSFSSAVANYLNRDLGSQVYTEVYNGGGGRSLALANYPVTAVASLTINDEPIPQQPKAGAIGFVPSPYRVNLVGYTYTAGFQNVTVTYTAGYVTIPADVEQCCIEWIADRYAQRDRIGIASRGVGGETQVFSVVDMPPAVKQILNPFVKVIPV